MKQDLKKVRQDPVEVFIPVKKLVVPVKHIVLDDKIETSQGEERTVRMLYEDYVLGRLDVRDLGGLVQYDSDDASECDPLNQFGVTLEETTRIADAGATARRDIAQHIANKRAEEVAKNVSKSSPVVSIPDPPKNT